MPGLLPESLPKLQATIFKTYLHLNSGTKDYQRIKYYLVALALLIKQCHYISLAVFSGSQISTYSRTSSLPYFLTLTRADVLLLSLKLQTEFSLMLIILLSLNALSKFWIFIQIYYKKRIFMFLPIMISNLTNYIMCSTLKIPISMYGILCIGSALNYTAKNSDYTSDFTNLKASYLIPMISLILLYYPLNFFDTLLSNQPIYSPYSHSRAHSTIQIQELLIVVVLSIAKLVMSYQYFLYFYSATALYNGYCFLYYFPYFSNLLNWIEIQTWVSVLVMCILTLVASSCENFYIAELNFIMLYIPLALLVAFAMKWRIERLKAVKFSQNPFEHELKIRMNLFDLKNKVDEYTKQMIFEHFKYANKFFFSFSQQYVWESLIIQKYIKDPELALVKIVKVNTVKYNGLERKKNAKNIIDTPYKYQFETNFLLFSIFSIQLKKLNDKNHSLHFVRYLNYITKFKDLDNEITHSLLDFTLVMTQESKAKSIEEKIIKIGSLIKSYKLKADLISSKFGLDPEFSKLFGSFLKDILNSHEGQQILNEFGLKTLKKSVINEENDFSLSTPIIIVSGWHKNIGTVIYANRSFFSLTKIDIQSKLIGESFTSLIPPPFDVIHNEVLFKYLFYRNSVELKRAHLFLLDINRHCIEVTMHFNLSYYKCHPYFTASFKPMLPVKNLVLCSMKGEIYSVSEDIEKIIPEIKGCIEASLPNIFDYLNKYADEETFEYNELGRMILIKKSSLAIDGYQMMVLYFDFLKFEEKSEMFLVKRKVEINITDGKTEEENKTEKNEQTTTMKNFKRRSIRQIIKSESYLLLSTAYKAVRVLKVSIIMASIFEFLLTLAILLVIMNIIQSLKVNSIIFDVGLMRFLSCSILSNTFSLELMMNNHTLAFNESFYKTTLIKNSVQLEGLLEKYREITLPVINQNKRYFIDTKLVLEKFNQFGVTSYNTNLYDTVKTIILNAQIISNTTLTDFPYIHNEKMFLYKNIPGAYITSINNTVMNIAHELSASLEMVFQYLKYIELISLLPPLVLLLIAVVCFYFIEKTNREFWRNFVGSKSINIIQARNRLIDRLIFTHGIEYFFDESSNKLNTNLRSTITIKPLMKILVLVAISLVFYFSIVYGPQALLLEMWKSEINHTNFGGMRRMLAPLTLFWARNAILESSNLTSYINIITNYEIPSSVMELNKRIDQYEYIQNDLMRNLKKYPDNMYGFHDYYELMFGNSCGIITSVDNCSKTIVGQGMDLGLKEYFIEVKSSQKFAKYRGFNNASLVRIEKYNKVIEKSFVYGLSVYSNYTDSVVEELKNDMSIVTFGFFIVLVLVYVLLLHQAAEALIQNLENKVEVIAVFSNMNPEGRKSILNQDSTAFHLKSSKII